MVCLPLHPIRDVPSSITTLLVRSNFPASNIILGQSEVAAESVRVIHLTVDDPVGELMGDCKSSPPMAVITQKSGVHKNRATHKMFPLNLPLQIDYHNINIREIDHT